MRSGIGVVLGGKRAVLVVVAVIAAVVALVLVVFLVTRSSDSSSPPTTLPPTGAGPSTFESFDLATGDLAGTSTPEGFTWQVPVGGFEANLGVVVADDAPQSLAILDLGAVPQGVTTEMLAIGEESGLVFRYRDSSNYWSVVAAPAYGTWNINRVIDGKLDFVANTGLGASPDSTLEVRLDGPAIRVLVNAQQRASLVAGELQQATGVGLIGSGQGPSRATWTSIGVLGR